ncbi:MAG: hypothetical protein V3V96_02385 [Acidiferrobacterales bacterium]
MKNNDINIALFARYRVNKWELHGAGWHSPEDDVSNVTVGGGYVLKVGKSWNFTGGLALADKSANIGTQLRVYLAGRYDFRCWSVGYIHYSNGDGILGHDKLPNEGVNLIVLGRKVEC